MDKDLLRDRFHRSSNESTSQRRSIAGGCSIDRCYGFNYKFTTKSSICTRSIVPEWEDQFNKLSEQFQQDVSDIVSGDPPSEDNAGDPPTENRAVDPPDPDKLATLFDNYEQETSRIFGIEPPDPDAPSAGDPPSEVDPPDPDKS